MGLLRTVCISALLLFAAAAVQCGEGGSCPSGRAVPVESPALLQQGRRVSPSPGAQEDLTMGPGDSGAELHGQHHSAGVGEPKEKLAMLREKLNSMRDQDGPWAGVGEDASNHSMIHCGELRIHADENVARGIWPVQAERVTTSAARTNACSNGAVSGYPCQNVDLLSFVPLSDFASQAANDVWGWSDPDTGKEYALFCLKEGTAFVDVSAPGQPVIVGTLASATTASIWRDVKVYGNHAFIVSEASGHGMQVFDLTRLRGQGPNTVFTADARYTGFGNAHNVVVNADTGRAFGVGTNTCSGGLHIVDIRNPTSPTSEGCFSADGYTHDAQCLIYAGPDATHQGKEICFAYNEDTVTIVDVSRGLQAPVQLSKVGYSGARYTHQGWLDEAQEYAYVNDELDEKNTQDKITKTLIFDVRDLDNPTYLQTHRHTTTSIDHNLYTHQGHVYEGNYCAGMRILKIQADHSLSEVAYFDSEPDCSTATFQGVWSVYPYFPSGTILVSSFERGLFMLAATGLDTPTAPPDVIVGPPGPDGPAGPPGNAGPAGAPR